MTEERPDPTIEDVPLGAEPDDADTSEEPANNEVIEPEDPA